MLISAWAKIQTHAFNLDPEYFQKLNLWQESSTQQIKQFSPSSLSSLYSKLTQVYFLIIALRTVSQDEGLLAPEILVQIRKILHIGPGPGKTLKAKTADAALVETSLLCPENNLRLQTGMDCSDKR